MKKYNFFAKFWKTYWRKTILKKKTKKNVRKVQCCFFYFNWSNTKYKII